MLDALLNRRQFILYRLEPKVDGGTDKLPTDPLSGRNCDAQDQDTWMTLPEAQLWASQYGDGYGVGIVIHEGSGLFCIDLDHCLDANGGWEPHVGWFMSQFSGAYTEVSVSGTGVHIIGNYTRVEPHGTRCKQFRAELYTKARFIAVTGTQAQGSPLKDCTPALQALVATYFPPHDEREGEWTDGPVTAWVGPADDETLIVLARRSHSPRAAFGRAASFDDLWTGNVEKLAVAFPPQGAGAYDASGADLALCNHLAFWTGNDCERMARLLRESGLTRGKHERPDYVQSTVLRACASQTEWYTGGAPPAATVISQAVHSVTAPTGPVAAGSPPEDPYAVLTDRTDKGNANLLVQISGGNLRYVAETRQWLRWNGRRWEIDTHETFITTRAVDVARYYRERAQAQEAAGRKDLAEQTMAWSSKCRNKSTLDNMVTLARKTEGVPISLSDMDRNPWLLGVDNGVVDLRTGLLYETEARDEFVTKRCPVAYNPAATCPRWEQFINEITGLPGPSVTTYVPRPALAEYLHRALGYALTGETREQKFFIAIGGGSNGKSVLFDTLKDMLGQYGVTLPAEALTVSKAAVDAERPTAVLASLAGSRLAIASETREGQRLDIGTIKNHTGDAAITARRMRENPITFKVTHKIFLLTNVRPQLDHIDAAIKGRLHLIPFDRRWNRPGEARDESLPDGDKTLTAVLKSEYEGILAWLVRGCMLYQQGGITAPTEVLAFTSDYMNEQDPLGQWLATMTKCTPADGTMLSDLVSKFLQWCMGEGYSRGDSVRSLGRTLTGRGINSVRVTAGMKYGLK